MSAYVYYMCTMFLQGCPYGNIAQAVSICIDLEESPLSYQAAVNFCSARGGELAKLEDEIHGDVYSKVQEAFAGLANGLTNIYVAGRTPQGEV